MGKQSGAGGIEPARVDQSPARGMVQPPSASVSNRMSKQRVHDTGPELQLRRELHRRGLRFRVNRPLEGMPRRRADITFSGARVVVFVDGCFWHSCPEHGVVPKSNREWWQSKLRENVSRDAETGQRLKEAGWTVIRVWEHEDVDAAVERIASVLALPLSTDRANRPEL